MTWAAILTLIVILAALGLLWADRIPADHALLGAVVVLCAAGVLEPVDAFAGFANPGMLTVAALFVVAAGLHETGAVGLLTERVLGRPRSPRGALGRLVPPVILASAWLNNTMIVASLLPAVREWSRRIGVPASRLLIPLSYASLLGGTLTVIGTSTNLVVAGLVEERIGSHPGLRTIGVFDMSLLGIAVAAVGAAVVIVLGPILLPDRRPALSRGDDPREYTAELLLPEGSRLAGRSIEEAGLRHLPGCFLMEIVRDDTVVSAVGGEEVLRVGDRLVFVGDVDAVVELQRQPGLVIAPDPVFRLQGAGRRIVEAVVSARNPLAGRSIRDAAFRNRYRAVVMAVARGGERLRGRIGDITLRAGDVLLLETHPDFVAEHRGRADFTLVSAVEGATPPRWDRAGRALAVLAALVVAFAFAPIPTVASAFLAAGAMVLMGCCSIDGARRALDLPVLVAIAAALGLGRALEVTGLAAALADLAVSAGIESPGAARIAVYVLCAITTEVLTNNAAAALCLPVALSMGTRFGGDPMAWVYLVMFAASASYNSPIGYQTNLMVFGPGGYRASDYARLGLPLSIAVGTTVILLAPRIWPG